MDGVQSGAVTGAGAAPNGRAPAPVSPSGRWQAAREELPAAPVKAPAAQALAPPQAEFSDVGRKAVEEAVAQIRKYVQASSASLDFSVDAGSGEVIMRITDGETQQLIRQIPSQEALSIARALDRLQGLFVTQKA